MEKIDKLAVLALLIDSSTCPANLAERINALPTSTDEWIGDKLFSAFIKSLLDSGIYSVTELATKDLETLRDAYHYWVDNLWDYPEIKTPELPKPPTK